jgi:hypothetical protein
MIDPTTGPTSQDLIIGVKLEVRPGALDPVPVAFDWAEWRIDADLSGLPKNEIGRLGEEYEAQVGQLSAKTADGNWNPKDWFALAPDGHERARLAQDLSELGVEYQVAEVSPRENTITRMEEEMVTDRAEIPFVTDGY